MRAPAGWPRLVSWGVLLAASVLFCWPLLTRANMPWGMDMSFAAQMTEGMLRGVGDGHLYPRWVDPMSRGLGAPAFVFYPPLAYWVSAALGWLTGDIVMGIRIVAVGGIVLSGLAFFLGARPLTSEHGAAIGAALYILLPYHLVDMYDRFAFAELCAFVWTPLLLLFVRRVAERATLPDAIGLALCYAGLSLTHLVTAYMMLLIVVPYGLWLAWRSGRWERIGWLAAAGGAGLLLAAIYLVPMLAEREHVNLQYLTESYFGNWRRNFAFRDETEFGFRPDAIKPAINSAAAWQAALAAAACAVAVFRCPPGSRGRADALLFTGLSVWVVYLQLPISTPVWTYLPELGTVQFPWRFGALQGLLAPLVAAVALSDREETGKARLDWRVAAAVLVLIAAPGIYKGLTLWELRKYAFNRDVASELRVQSKALLEYTPKGATQWRETHRLPFVPPLLTGLASRGEARVISWSSHERRVAYRSEKPNRLWIATFHHPGWRARIEATGELPLGPAPGSAFLTAEVPAGEHEVVFEFGSTLPRRIGAVVSGLTLLALLALGGLHLRRRSAPV